MTLTINDNSKISTIQEEFNTMFPYLKVEFFSKQNRIGTKFSKSYLNQYSKTIGEYRTIYTRGTISITPEMTVIDLEKKINDIFGLGIEVFRQSGKVWLETTLTDAWTLEKQNRQGESLSKMIA